MFYGISGIYRIRCIVTGKQYIGSASNVGSRWSNHKHYLSRGKHASVHLQRAWDKHGADAFVLDVIEVVEDGDDLTEREQYWLDKERPFGERGYNIATIAGRTTGVKRTPEQVEKMASRFRGKKLSAEHRAKIGAAGRGRKHKPETIAKLRAARLANNHQVGRPLTERQKAALHRSGEDHPFWGRRHSKQTKEAMSASRSRAIVQILEDGTERVWRTASSAATALGLRSADSIYRAIYAPHRRAAGCHWRWADAKRAVVS